MVTPRPGVIAYCIKGPTEHATAELSRDFPAFTPPFRTFIASEGQAGDSGIVRIGTAGHQHGIFIQGIYGKPIAGSTVTVSSTGELGVIASSERFKTGIKNLELDEGRLERLRPVSFHMKRDPNGPVQYGLIAEEVDQVEPDLVIRDGHGRFDGVRYDELTPFLLKEVQNLRQRLSDQRSQFDAKVAMLEQRVDEMQAAFVQSNESVHTVASR